MNHRTRIRLLQAAIAAGLAGFVGLLAWMLTHREPAGDGAPPGEDVAPLEELSREAVDQDASQITTGFEVMRTRDGMAELTVRAERLLGLEGDVFRLEQPTLEIHDDGGTSTIVTGREGTFRLEAGVGRVEGDARATGPDGVVVESDVLRYRSEGGAVDAEGSARFVRPGMRGRSSRLRYEPGGGALVLEGAVHVVGTEAPGPGAPAQLAGWTLETGWLRYVPDEARVRTDAFRLVSVEGTLTGERLDLELAGPQGGVKLLVARGDAVLRTPVEGADARRVVRGQRIEMEPAPDGGRPLRLLARTDASVRREGEGADAVRDLTAAEIEWTRREGILMEARRGVQMVLEDAALLTASELVAELDADGALQGGRLSAPVRYEGADGAAQADEATFAGGGETVVLLGKGGRLATVEIPEGRISARRIEMRRGPGEVIAEGDVRTLHRGSSADGGLFEGDQPVHGTADRVRALRAEGILRYEGAARLWQGDNLLQARDVEVRREAGELEAWHRVSTRSLTRDGSDAPGAGAARPVLGRADHLLYRDADRTAAYKGEARLEWGAERVEGDEAQVMLGEGRKVSRVRATGNVELWSPTRYAAGHHLDYDAAAERAVLRAREGLAVAQNLENQQLVRGETLTIDLADGTIRVQSGPGGRTWIAMSPGAEERGQGRVP